MTKEQFLNAVGDIDDKFIKEMTDAPEEPRESLLINEEPQEVYLTSGHIPFWKLAFSAAAAVCVLAAGIFAAAKVHGIQPNEAHEVHLDNLDYENAVIIENTPNTGKWQTMSFDFPVLSKESADRMTALAANYGNAIEKKDILLMLNEYAREEDMYVPLSDYDRYLTDANETYPYSVMSYCTDDIYIEVQGPTGGCIELDNRKNVNSILGLDCHFTAPWRPYFFRRSSVSVDLSDESATCVLDGKTVKISDTIKNAEKYVLENDLLFPKAFGARVQSADLIGYEETENQSLYLLFEFTIDGVVLDGSPSLAIYDEDGKKYKAYTPNVECGMLTENTIDWIWFPVIDGATTFTSEDCEIAISREKACEIVSRKLSQEHSLNVKEIQLMYVAERAESGKYYWERGKSIIEPMWRFHIKGIKAQEYSELYVYVSAINGEVQISEVMR